VLEAIDLDSIEVRGYAFQVEMTYRAIQAGFTVAEVPIVFRDRRAGESKMDGSIVAEAIFQLPRLRFGSHHVERIERPHEEPTPEEA
jgi:dolichol-phosphate mannosyltransferase